MNQLEIGAGHNAVKRPGWVNADLTPGPNIDVVFDASKPNWDVRPNSFLIVEANHVIEHLPDFWGFFEGAWNSLREGGYVNIRLPYGASSDALGDPTHLRTYYPASFCALQPGYGEAVYNPQHKWDYPFEIMFVLIRVRKHFRWLCWPFIRVIGLSYIIPYLWDSCVEQIVTLRKLPRGAKLARPANMVPIRYCMDGKDYGSAKSMEIF